MHQDDEKLIRKQFLISGSNEQKLLRIAAAEGCSAGEVVRRAIEAYDPEREEHEPLTSLIGMLDEQLVSAINSIDLVNHKIDDALQRVERAEHGYVDTAEIRKYFAAGKPTCDSAHGPVYGAVSELAPVCGDHAGGENGSD